MSDKDNVTIDKFNIISPHRYFQGVKVGFWINSVPLISHST